MIYSLSERGDWDSMLLDDDINQPFFLRFSPHAKKYWTHQFQHIYVWFFYGLSTISWITTKDFVRINRYHKMGFLVEKNEFRNAVVSIAAWKILYYSFALIMPLIMVNLPWWHILLAFLSMHFFLQYCEFHISQMQL